MRKILLALICILIVHPVACIYADDIRMANISIQDMLLQFGNIKEMKYTNEWADEIIDVKLRLSWHSVPMKLTNNSNSIIQLIWDKSVFVDTKGKSTKILPGETKIIHTDLSISNAIIPPNASFETLVYVYGYGEKDLYKMILDYPVDTTFGRPLGGLPKKNSKEYAKFANKYVDQKLTMLLCFLVNGQEQYYQFNLNLDFAEGIKNLPQTTADGEIIEAISIGWILDEVRITEIKTASLAEKAGLKADDVIKEINLTPAEEIKNIDTYVLEKVRVGSSVMLLCDRDGEHVLITLKKTQ